MRGAQTVFWAVLLCAGAVASVHAGEALSFGAGRCGKLTGGMSLPCTGQNFESGSRATCVLGRHHLHPLVVATITDAYALLKASHPGRMWQYGEMGLINGGAFPPHRTHQNGRAADFFFPAMDAQGQPQPLSIHPGNLLGYAIHFAADGSLGSLRLDVAALVDHLAALEKAGAPRGVKVHRVIIDGPFQRMALKARPDAAAFKERFNKHRVWVAHDQHYHVDFNIPHRLKRPMKCKTDGGAD